MEVRRRQFIDEAHQEHSVKVESLEAELASKDEDHENAITSIQQTSEEQVAQLKLVYAQEHARLEERAKYEKDSASKRLTVTTDEFENKIRE